MTHSPDNDSAPEIKHIHPANPSIFVQKTNDYPYFILNSQAYVTSDATTNSKFRIVRYLFDTSCFIASSDICTVLTSYKIEKEQVVTTTATGLSKQGLLSIDTEGLIDFGNGENARVEFDDSMTNMNGFYALRFYGKIFKNPLEASWLFTENQYTNPIILDLMVADFLITTDPNQIGFIPTNRKTIEISGRDFDKAEYVQPTDP